MPDRSRIIGTTNQTAASRPLPKQLIRLRWITGAKNIDQKLTRELGEAVLVPRSGAAESDCQIQCDSRCFACKERTCPMPCDANLASAQSDVDALDADSKLILSWRLGA
jgi:hypothetical protein